MLTKVLVIAASLVLGSLPVRAENVFDFGGVKVDIATGPKYAPCFKAAGGNDLGMAACISAETELWDRRLNAAYTKLRAQLTKSDFVALQAFQRAWIKDRDAACGDDGQQGTAGRVESHGCFLRYSAIRAAELEMRAADVK